jgi:hypothetical protein
MNVILLKNSFCLVLMIGFLILAFTTKDTVNSKLFASLSIIIGAVLFKEVGTKNISHDEKYRKNKSN